MAENVWDAKINVDIDAAQSQQTLRSLTKDWEDQREAAKKAGRAIEDVESQYDQLIGSFRTASAQLNKLDRSLDGSNNALKEQARQAQATERAIKSLYQEYASGQIKMGKTPAKMSAWLPTSGIPKSDLDQVSAADLAVNASVTRAIREQEQARIAAARAAERQAEAERRLRATQQGALAKAQGRLGVENEAEEYRKLEASVGRAEAAKKRLAMAQREVNAAQGALRGAVGDIVAQTAATNRLADAKRKLAQAEVAARTASQPAGNPDSARYALYDVAATAGTGAALGGIAIGAVVKNYALLDSQLAIVSRTSALTGHNMDMLGESLLDMGSRIPISLKGLTDMAARAAQLGVEGSSNILAFTETMSKFAAVSDTVTETEVAEYFGRLNNLTGGSDNWESLADSVAKVGINSAATDQQILKTAQEVAQAAAGANYAADEIIGLSGAFASLGVPPERARSVLLDFNKIMTEGMGESTESMKMLSAQMGISEDSIRDMWRAKPTELISGMAKAMKDMAPEEAMNFLQDFGLKGQRALPVFLALAKDAKSAGDGISVLDRALDDADFENSAGELDKQFAKTMETLTASWQMFLNSLQNVGFESMVALGPLIADVLDNAGDLLDWAVDFTRSPIGQVVGTITVALGGLATALMGVTALATMAAASFLAIRTAGTQLGGTRFGSMFAGMGGGASVAGIRNVQTAAVGATGAIVGMGAATERTGSVIANRGGRIQGTMDKVAGAAGRATGTLGNGLATAATNLGKVGGAAVGLLGGPLGATLILGTAVAGIAASAANAEGSYRGLGQTISAVNEETGLSAQTASGMFEAAEDNLRANYGWMIGAQDLLTGLAGVDDPWKFDLKNAKEYIKLVGEGSVAYTTRGTTGGSTTRTVGGVDGARASMGLQGEILDTQFQEIGKGLAKLDSSQAAIGFEQLSSTLGVTSENMDAFVTSLGPEFSAAMGDAGKAAGFIKGEIGDVGYNAEVGAYVMSEYAKSALGVKAAFQETFPVLEEMNEGFTGTFSGMAENAATLNGVFTGMVTGAASADQLTQALVALGAANGETGELITGNVDIYDELAGKFNLTSSEAQNALASLGAFGEGQVAGITANYQFLETMLGTDEAIRQTKESMDAARQTFIDSAIAMGVPAEQAGILADKIGLIPGSKFIMIDASSSVTAAEKVMTVATELADLPVNTTVTVTGMTEEAREKLIGLGYTVSELDGTTATVTANADTEPAIAALNEFTNTSWSMRVSAYVDYYDGANYTNPLSGAGNNGGPKTPVANGGLAGSTKKFANGNYTGAGGKWDPAGIVHAKEYVFPARSVDPVKGVPTQDALGRMMAQHYPNAMAPTVVVQGGGQGGVVELGPQTTHALVQALQQSGGAYLDGRLLTSAVNGTNRGSTRTGAN